MSNKQRHTKGKYTIKAAPALPFPNGGRRRIYCMEGCGRQVAGAVGICRKCRKAGKFRAAKESAKFNKRSKKSAE